MVLKLEQTSGQGLSRLSRLDFCVSLQTIGGHVTLLLIGLNVLVVDLVGALVEGPEVRRTSVVKSGQATIATATVLKVLDLVAHLVTDGGLEVGLTLDGGTEDHLSLAVVPTVVALGGPGGAVLIGPVLTGGTTELDDRSLFSHSHQQVPVGLVNLVVVVNLSQSRLRLLGHVSGLGLSLKTNHRGGGGGGAGRVGANESSSGAAGGSGVSNSLSGSAVTYATGGKGAGNYCAGDGPDGAANTGDGGGALRGDGGSGIVILKGATADATIGATRTGLTDGGVQTDGSDSYIIFTAGTGTVSFS